MTRNRAGDATGKSADQMLVSGKDVHSTYTSNNFLPSGHTILSATVSEILIKIYLR